MGFFNQLFPSSRSAHPTVVGRTAAMVRDRHATRLARRHGLRIVDLTWEDTARYAGSCLGPNISDMTIQVRDGAQPQCMPVIRHPNFGDRTADVKLDQLYVKVGNEQGRPLRRVSLRTYLRNLRRHLHDPTSWPGGERSLLSPREQEVLVSAQACFLPVPREGIATFNPVLFNYQSYGASPAVLAIVASREGTSATVIDNQRDGFGAGHAWGQRLFFNDDGERASFTGTRLEEFVDAGGDALDQPIDAEAAKRAGLSCVLLIQVPLVQRVPPPPLFSIAAPSACAPGGVYRQSAAAAEASCDVDEAVIGHGETEGPFTEIDGHPIERDHRFPIRVTVQFYKATSNGVVDEAAMHEIASQIRAVYEDGTAIGSLVTDGDAGRSSAWDDGGQGKQPPTGWWAQLSSLFG